MPSTLPRLPLSAQTENSVAPSAPRSRRKLVQRAIYRLWKRLPGWCQVKLVALFAPKFTLAACAVIRDAEGRVLLMHHTYRRRPWGLPGGFVRTEEQPADALAREVREELGVEVKIGPVLCADARIEGRHLTLYYRASIDGTPRCDEVEVDTLRYVAPDQVAQFIGSARLPWLSALLGEGTTLRATVSPSVF